VSACIDVASAADEAEFAAFVERHGAGLLRAVRRRVASVEDAQDVTQEALLRTWRKRHDHADDTHRRNFAHHVAGQLVIDLHRSKDHQVEARPEFADDVLGSAPSPAELYVRSEERARVTAALGALPPDQRSLLVDADLHELSLDELRERYGVTAEVLRYRRFRARRALRRQIERTGAPALLPVLLRRVPASWRNAWHRLQDSSWLPTGAQAAVVVLTTIGIVTGPFSAGVAPVRPAHADTPPAAVAPLALGARPRVGHPTTREARAAGQRSRVRTGRCPRAPARAGRRPGRPRSHRHAARLHPRDLPARQRRAPRRRRRHGARAGRGRRGRGAGRGRRLRTAPFTKRHRLSH
jgi:RNA polymerase sigma-70 factor (ECF subfamily)